MLRLGKVVIDIKNHGIMNLQGKEIEILEMNLTSGDGGLTLTWKMRVEGSFLTAVFRNVSELRFDGLSVPVVIHGFEVVDHTADGWQENTAYEIRDFENGIIEFYCGEVTIKQPENIT